MAIINITINNLWPSLYVILTSAVKCMAQAM